MVSFGYNTSSMAQRYFSVDTEKSVRKARLLSYAAVSVCRKYDVARAYQSSEEMLAAEKLDGCIAVVPAEDISEVGSKLLHLGIPCVIEKPLGASISGVKALFDTARATHTRNMLSANRRFTLARHARTEPEFLWVTAVHAVDALRHIAGEVEDAQFRTLKNIGRAADWYAIDFRFASGVSGRIDILPAAGALEESYEPMGADLRALVTCPFGPQRGWRAYRENRLAIEETASDNMPEDVLNGCYDDAAEFIRALTRKQAPHPSIEDVFPSVELCLAMAKTAEQSTRGQVSGKS